MASSPYKQPLKSYCAVYKVSYRTILRWKDAGLPLDDEAQTRLLLAAGLKFPPQSPTNAPSAAPGASSGALGLSASIQRLQEAERGSHSAYQEALASGQEALAALRRKEWLAVSEQLRRVEQSTPDIEEANKKAVLISDLQAALGLLFRNLRNDLDNLGKRLAGELVAKDAISIKELIDKEAAAIVETLYECKYL